MKDNTPKYTIVENYIKQGIKNKSIVDKLPGERILAEELGFSYMTIRKAINNLANQGVLYKVPTKGTFVNTAQKKNKTHTIGYYLDSSIKAGISSPYYSLIYNAIEREAAKNDYSVVYFSDLNDAHLHNSLSRLDGVIATCFPYSEHIIATMKELMPVVVIDNASEDKTIPSVVIDNFTADYNSVNYLVNLGHREIAFMTGLENSDVGRNRCAGYRQGLQHNQIPVDENLIFHGNYTYSSGMEGAEYYLSLPQHPSAIICANDTMALGAIQRLKQAGINIPEEMSIIGFDDIEVASQVSPALTTNAAPVEEIAEHAFNMLEKMIAGKPLAYHHVSLTAYLVTRASCGALNKQIDSVSA